MERKREKRKKADEDKEAEKKENDKKTTKKDFKPLNKIGAEKKEKRTT